MTTIVAKRHDFAPAVKRNRLRRRRRSAAVPSYTVAHIRLSPPAPPAIMCNVGREAYRELAIMAARDVITPGAAAARLLRDCLLDDD